MSEGQITITDKEGGTILSANIWTFILVNIYTGGLFVDPKKIRVFVDEKEIRKPKVFEDDT